MIDIKRKVPRFNVKFRFSTNEIEGRGINISQKGLAFLLDEELVPAEDVSFSTSVEGFIFSKKVYLIKGSGKLLYSTRSKEYGDLYYNGFEFTKLDGQSQENLLELLEDIHRFQKAPDSEFENKTLADFIYYPSSDLLLKADFFYDVIKKKVTTDLKMFSYYLDSASSSTSQFIQRVTGESKKMIMLGSNNYLGLTTHPEVIKAGIKAMEQFGTGSGSGAMVGGTFSIHKELEEQLADFVGKESVMLFNSGYSANLGAISGLLRPKDAVINDQFNHASIFDGCALSGAKTLIFSHNNISSLERTVKRARRKYNGLMIVVDGVYSTDGRTAPLAEITRLAKQYDCRIMVDEAHGFGILGKKGIGAVEHFQVVDNVDIVMATMSKALAGVGGFIASSKEAIEYMRYYGRSYLFSTNITPSVAGTILKALQILREDKSIRERLHYNVNLFKKRLLEMNIDIGDPKAAIVPIFIADMNLLLKVSSRLFSEGVFHNVMTYPAVPLGGSLLRFGIMATHTEKELNRALSIIEKTAREEGLFDYYRNRKTTESIGN